MTDSLAELDKRYSLHPYTHLANHAETGPFVIEGGDGIHVIDDAGRRYIEGVSGLWCTSLGFSEKRLADAATRQLEAMPYSHLFTHRANVPAIELAEKLVNLAPDGIERAFFVNSGSEAIDTAIKFAWYYWNAKGRPTKKRFIARRRAYHGVTVAAGSLTGLPYAQDGFDLPAIPVTHVTPPHAYREARIGESDEDFARRLAAEIDDAILEAGPENVAAFVAEPVMGAGGVLIPPATYFEKVQAVLSKHEVLMIADEVICGFCRTGSMWGSQTYGIRPDIVTCAKQLSSAYQPIGAVLVTGDLYDAFVEHSATLGTFGTGFTYGGHPVACAVALETLRIYEDDDVLGHVNAVSPRFSERVQALQNHPLVGDARSVGLIGAIELVADKGARTAFPADDKIALKVFAAAREHGVIVRAVPGDGIAFCPPLIIDEDGIDAMFDGVAAALGDVQRALGGRGG